MPYDQVQLSSAIGLDLNFRGFFLFSFFFFLLVSL